MPDVQVRFYPQRTSGKVPKGTTVLDAAWQLGISLEGPCNGTGRCGKDLVQVRGSSTLYTVLACKTPIEEDLEIIIPSREDDNLKTVECFSISGSFQNSADSLVRKEAAGHAGIVSSTAVYIDERAASIEEGDTRHLNYGLAVDLGTTTIVIALVDLNSGEIIGSSSALNPLLYYGHDVMSRIRYAASQQGGLRRMHRELISTVNLLADVLSAENEIRPEHVYHMAVAGNTTMQHIFMNREIRGIGEYPYVADTLEAVTSTAGELGVHISEYAPVTTFPCISAYVGGDIVSGLLAMDMKRWDVPALFVDIGTNGEMVLLTCGRTIATSTAAGPCFEGMTISSGMRAGQGAIEHVSLNSGVSIEVIGNVAARGICGSGLLDLVSELIRTNLVNHRGRLQHAGQVESGNTLGRCLMEKDGRRHFVLVDDITISQEDIRQVQLAKAAIRSGVDLLLAEGRIRPEEIRNVIIAGAFGYHLNERSLRGVGLLPEFANAAFSFVGNSSLGGAVRMLLNRAAMEEAEHIANQAEAMDLSQIAEFEEVFVREMRFSC